MGMCLTWRARTEFPLSRPPPKKGKKPSDVRPFVLSKGVGRWVLFLLFLSLSSRNVVVVVVSLSM